MELTYYYVLLAIFVPAWAISYWVLPYFTTYRHLKHIPGPVVARFSNIWLALGARQGKKFAWVDWAHRKYGKVVRVGFNHVSIATPEGLNTVYAHGNGFLKEQVLTLGPRTRTWPGAAGSCPVEMDRLADEEGDSHFYEAFVSGVPGVFNVRDRAEHTRKRKIIAHAFSPGAVHDFEPHMSANLERWVQELSRRTLHPDTEDGFTRVNMMPWCTFIAFDIIGDLAFGAPFGMVERGRDECEVWVPGQPATYVPGAETLNRRGEVSSTIGLLPALRPYAEYLPDPFFSKGLRSVKNLHGIAEAAVSKRLAASEKGGAAGTGRMDILEMLCRATDGDGDPMPRDELVSEALTQLIAGSDTVSNTACAVLYWILDGERRSPGAVVPRLRAELDAAVPPQGTVARHGQVKGLGFLRRCIDEGMRLHSTSALGLPRIVTAAEGVSYPDTHGGDSLHFPRGTVLSVPSYTIHHDPDVWGQDVDEFRPDRWLPENLSHRQKTGFNPFSYGPRACVGQNVAHMELSLIIATAFHCFDFELYQSKMESHEGFSKKPDECWLGVRRRRRAAA